MPIGRSFCVYRQILVMIVFQFEASLPSSIVFPETYPHQVIEWNPDEIGNLGVLVLRSKKG
ncbi:hypothetical protein Hanom_Chr06g00503481 [Helianthus anomalus]